MSPHRHYEEGVRLIGVPARPAVWGDTDAAIPLFIQEDRRLSSRPFLIVRGLLRRFAPRNDGMEYTMTVKGLTITPR